MVGGKLQTSSIDVYLALEFCAGGDLHALRGQMTAQQIRHLIAQTVMGVQVRLQRRLMHTTTAVSCSCMPMSRGGAAYIRPFAVPPRPQRLAPRLEVCKSATQGTPRAPGCQNCRPGCASAQNSHLGPLKIAEFAAFRALRPSVVCCERRRRGNAPTGTWHVQAVRGAAPARSASSSAWSRSCRSLRASP